MNAKRALFIVSLAALLTSAASAVKPEPPRGNPNPGISLVHAQYNGHSYGEWSARFWQWALSMPVDHHPLTDTAPVSEGQSGKVWFLGGSFASTPGPNEGEFLAIATRDVTIPTGTALFFPVLCAEMSDLEAPGATEEELRSIAQWQQDLASNLWCEIDGRMVKNLDSYRVQSPLFPFGPLPDNNVVQVVWGIADAVEGSTGVSVGDGVFLMLPPLSAGKHTIHFHGEILVPEWNFFFYEDITYNITVAGPGKK